LNLQ
jgi:hypothetical protein